MKPLDNLREQFPVLKNNPGLVYLDSGATSLKPQSVIDATLAYYERYTANVKRGIYGLSVQATDAYEASRDAVAGYINASREEVIFTRNTTEGLNLVMYSLGANIVRKGDEIVVSIMEHHSNFVPWQQLAAQTGAHFKVIEADENGNLGIVDPISGGIVLKGVVTKRTKILALTHVSNVLGTINPIKEIIHAARRINPHIIVVVDGAQAAPNGPLDMKALDADFYAFSGHKMYGPSGIGVLYGKRSLLEQMVPFLYGGEMIREVRLDDTQFAELPEKFEAGTPAIGEAIGLGAAVKFLNKFDPHDIKKHKQALLTMLIDQASEMFGNQITIISNQDLSKNAGIFTFKLATVHPHDIASLLDEHHIAVRAGNHCAMPLHTSLGNDTTTRVSLGLYNTEQDVKVFLEALQTVVKAFS